MFHVCILPCIHDFHNGGPLGRNGNYQHQSEATKARSNMATAMAGSDSVLTEADIPGASLNGRKPSELKNEELKFWLRCRDDPAKGLKTKAELVKR